MARQIFRPKTREISIRLLALSGSLRAGSLNTGALRALQKLAPVGVVVALYEGIGALPHFNYDVEMSALPESVAELRWQVASADGVVIACPEYAHGIPGSFKNALDWLVGMPDFPGKPVMFINTSPRGLCRRRTWRSICATEVPTRRRLSRPCGPASRSSSQRADAQTFLDTEAHVPA